jgi:tetratricopeptide (TPR) repeat protein
LFRHRLDDARLDTVERDVLGVRREGELAGWEIPGRYLDFVRGGPARPLAAVLAHNADDVVSLARLLAHLDACYADPAARTLAPAGDLVALARAFTRDRRHREALDCLDRADAAWRPATLGSAAWPFGVQAPSPALLSRDRIRAERARTLRRLGRTDEALAAWEALAADSGAMGPRAWVEAAKVREHALRDPAGALRAAESADRAAERMRLRWGGDPDFETALAARLRRLRRRTAARVNPAPTA